MEKEYKKDEALTTAQVAKKLNVTEDTLRAWRMKNTGPKFIKYGETKQSIVRYMRSSVEAYIEENTNKTN